MKLTVSCAIALAAGASAHGYLVTWTPADLVASTGSFFSQSSTVGSDTLNVSTSDGFISPLNAGIFTGIWFSQNVIADGTYVLDFNGAAVDSVSFTVNAISGNGPSPFEQFQDFATIGGPGTLLSTVINSPLSAYGTGSLSTLVIAADQGLDEGTFTVTVTSSSSFTGLSFRHTQNPQQNGSVLIGVEANIVPAPAAGALAGLGLLAAARRRR